MQALSVSVRNTLSLPTCTYVYRTSFTWIASKQTSLPIISFSMDRPGLCNYSKGHEPAWAAVANNCMHNTTRSTFACILEQFIKTMYCYCELSLVSHWWYCVITFKISQYCSYPSLILLSTNFTIDSSSYVECSDVKEMSSLFLNTMYLKTQ